MAELREPRKIVIAQQGGGPSLAGLGLSQGTAGRRFTEAVLSQGRAFSQAMMSIAGTRQRSGRLWLTLLATLIVIALLIVQVSYRHREIRLGYALSSAIAKREALHEENRKLRIERRVLSSRERLEPMARRQLGMSRPRPEQIILLSPQTTPSRRAAVVPAHSVTLAEQE